VEIKIPVMAKKKSATKNLFRFSGKLTELKGAFTYCCVLIPEKVQNKLPEGRLRLKGSLNGVPIDLAIQYRKKGPRFIMVSKVLARRAKVKPGDLVDIEFALADPSVVEVPEELQAVLDQDDEGRTVWNSITPGLQRSLCYYVKSVRNVDSRIKRALDIIHKVKTRQLYLQRKKA
jgi:hypothetical protein